MPSYCVGLKHREPSLCVFYLWQGFENCFKMPTYLPQMSMHIYPLFKLLFSRTMHNAVLVNVWLLQKKKKKKSTRFVAFADFCGVNTPTMANLKLPSCH